MSREIKRVDPSWEWPRSKVWEGYLTPARLHGAPCPDCKGGQTYAGWWLQTICYRFGMLGNDIRDQDLGRPLHPWLAEDPYPVTDDGVIDPEARRYIRRPRVRRPSRDILDLISGLSGQPHERLIEPFGCNVEYDLYRALVTAAGLDGTGWGECTTCAGEGSLERYEGQRAEREAWEPHEPPTGTGWVMFETVSEGSPVSPVFGTAEELAQWLATDEGGAAARPHGTAMEIEAARRFVSAGWAPSGILDASGYRSGVDWVAENQEVETP